MACQAVIGLLGEKKKKPPEGGSALVSLHICVFFRFPKTEPYMWGGQSWVRALTVARLIFSSLQTRKGKEQIRDMFCRCREG